MNFIKRKYNDRVKDIKKNFNLIKSMTDTPKFIEALKYGHKTLSYSFRQVFEPAKNMNVISLEIIRNPLSKPLQSILSSFTGFELERKLKNENYDALFHLKIRINNKFDFEKEQAANFSHAKNNPNQEIMNIDPRYIKQGLTIGELVENTIKAMGNAFFNYDGLKNNCQDFILAVLHSNGIYNSEYDNFVKQNTDEIFKSTPSLLKGIMNKVTDLANRAQILTEGTGLNQTLPDDLSNFQIIAICKKLKIPLTNVIMKDELTMRNFKNGYYIMNLQNHNQSGSHWTAFIKNGSNVFYCDSFGEYPPQNEYNIFLKTCKDVYINTQQFQPINSDRCGFYAIMFLWYMYKYNPTIKTMMNYQKIYNYKNLKLNDNVKNIILHKLYRNEKI